MTTQTPENYADALGKLRTDLHLKRGYGSRIAKKLKVSRHEVYNVAWGRAKNPQILKALVDEAKNTQTTATESFDIIRSYLSGSAA